MKLKNLALAFALVLVGCLGPISLNDPNYIEAKAYRVTERVVTKVLADQPAARPKIEKALAGLQVLEKSTNITLVQIKAITDLIPKVANSKYSFYTDTAVLIFEDELSSVGVKNPPLLQGAVHGMARATDEVLKR